MDDLGVGALDATSGQRTPSKSPAGRAFGTRLSANSPLQVQREQHHLLQLQQGTAVVPKSAPSLSRSARKKGRLATINETTRSGKKKKDTRLPRSQQKVVDRYNDAAAFEKHYSAATSSSARKSPSPLTSTSTSISREGLDYSSIGATTPSSALRSTARSVATAAASATISTSSLTITPTNNTEHRGKNLIDNFNSTSSPAITIDANDKTYTPQSVKESEDGSKPWTNVTSSASSWGLAAFQLPPSSYKSEYKKSTVDNAAVKTLTPPLRVLWKELGDDYRPSPSPADQRSSSNTTSTSRLSPSLSSKKVLFASSLVSSSSDNVKSIYPPPTAVAIPKEISIGPSEYAIRFPSGQLSLHLVFEPVTQTSGHMMGCGIAKISPLFYDKLKSNVFNYIPAPASGNADEEVDGAVLPEAVEKMTIQVNDLLVSINGIPVLSRKYDVIMEMLHDERYQHTDRIIVFRSIEKLWHSRGSTGSSSYSNHFTRRTMRHLRTGRRVATALNDDVLLCTDDDNGNNGDSVLRTWVETPTQVPLRHSRKNRLMSVDECNDRNSFPMSNASNEDGSYVERTDSRINLTTLVKDNEKEDVAEAETGLISSLSLMSSTSKATSVPAATKTPSYVLTEIDMDMMTMIHFSPSNVKKIMKSGGSGIKCKRSDTLSPVIREVSGTQASHTITSPDTQVTRVQLFTVASPIASTVKRSNVRRSSSKKPQLQTIDERLGDIENNVTSSTSPSTSSHTMERIGKILMGNENLGDLGSDFEHSLRLKKAVLEEIKYVYFLLFVGEKKQRPVNDRLDMKSSGSEPLVQEENDVSVEVLVMPTPSHKIMLDMKSRLDDSYSKVKELEEEVLVLKKLSTPSTDPGVRRALLTEGPMSHPLSAGRSSSNIFDIDDRFLDPKWGIIRRSDESVVISPLVNTSNYQRQSQNSLASGGVVSLTDICNDDMEHEDKEKEVMRKGYEDIVDELRSQISDLIAEANERDASHAEQVRILEQQLSGKDYDAIVTTLEQRVAVIEADGDIVRIELENARSDLVKTKEEADAALKAVRDERQAEKDELISKCTAIDTEKRECLKQLECVAAEKMDAEAQLRETNEELKRLNKRISVVVVDRETVRLELEKARMSATKAKEDADATLNEILAEKDKVVSKCNAIESEKRECMKNLERVMTEKEELEVQLRETSEKLVQSKEHITSIEVDRNGMHLELRETLARFTTEKEELEVQLRESNEELVVKCIAIESEKRECVEKLERAITEKEESDTQLRGTNEELVRIKERVVFIEADRDGALLELEQARIATDIADAALKTMLDEKLAENDELLAECNAIESEKRECIKILDRVTTEKEEVEAQLRESNEELARLKEQVQTLSEKNSQLELKCSTTVAELAETRQATKQEMLHCHEQILTLEKQVHSLESTLEVVARDKVDMQQQLNDLDTAGLRLAYEKENLDAQLRESNDQLKRVKMQVLEERNNLNMRISTASSHLSKARETVQHQNHYASTFEEQVRYLEKTHAMELKDMGNMQQLLKKLDAAGLRLACEKEEVEAQLKESNDQLAKVTDQVFFLSEEKNMMSCAEESIKLHKSEMQERESVTNEKIVSLERCIEELEIERESNHIQIAQLAAANESYANERDAWIGRLNKLEVEISEGIVFKTEIESLSSSISLLDSKLAAAESTVNALTLDLIAKENDLTCLRQESKLERESMTLQLDNLQSDTTALNEVVNELQASKNDVISQNATLVAEVSHLSDKLVESSNATQRHKDLYIDLKYKLEAAEDLLDEGDGELDHLHSECERLEKEVSDLQAIVINAEGAADNAKKECESLTNQNESIACLLNSEIKNLRERERDFIDQIKNAEKLHDLSSQDLMNKLAKSQDDVIERKTLVTDLESKLEVATTSLAEANATIQILGLDCACLKKQANDLEKLLANEKDASSMQKETIDLLTTGLADLGRERDSLAVDISFKQSEIRAFGERVRELSNQLDIQGKAVGQFQEQLDISRRDALENTAQTIDLKSKLESAKHLLLQGKTEVERLEEQISNLNIVLNGKEEIVTTQTDQIRLLGAELSELQFEKESIAATLNKNIAEIRELSFKLQMQVEINATLQRKHDTQVNQLVKEIDDSLIETDENEASAEVLLSNLLRLLTITKEALSHQKDENRSLKVELARVDASKDELESERDAMAVELKLSADRIIDLEDTIVESESKIIQLETTVANLQSHHVNVSELNNNIAFLNESLIEREQEKLSLLSDLRELEVTINDLTSGLQHAETQFNSQMKMNVLQQQELVSRNNELTLTVEKLSTNLHDAEAKSCRDLLSHEVARSQLMSDIRDLQNLVSATKIKLETINSDHLRVVKEKESELESKAVVIMSNKQEIVRLTNKVASLEQVLVLLESEGTTTMDAVDTTRKHFERERESLNDCIQELQLKLGESRDTAKKEESELESLREKISASNQIEHDLREKVSISQDEIKRLSDELDTVMKCHENSLSEIGEKRSSSIEEVVDELHVHKINVDQLRKRLLEETDLCSSLRDLVTVKEQTIHDQLSEIDLLNTKIKSIQQRESQFTREKQQLCSTINEQKLAQELSNQSEMRLGLMLKAMRFDYDQMVVDFSDTREAITKSIESFKLESDEVVRRVVNAFKADIFVSRRDIESVSNKLSQAMKHYQEVLALKDKEIQRQEDSLQELRLQLNETTNGFEIATHDWEQEKVSYEVRLQTLQDEVDENVCLKSEIECAKLAYSDKLSTIESDWKSFQLALHQLTACIAHDDHELPIEAIPDTTTLLQTFVELFQQKLDQISTLQLQLTAQSQDDHAACDLLSKLNDMSRKLSSETSYRQLAEMKCIAAETAVADEKVRISVLEHQSKETEENALLQAKEIESLKAHIETLKSQIDEINTKDQLLSREARDLEVRLEQAKGQKKSLELKYERSLAEIETCTKHSNDLMTIIIEKNKDVQSKEGKVLDLQYQVDDLQSKIDGWVCAFNGMSSTAAEQLEFSSPDDAVTNIVATSALCQDKQTADIAKLEEQCLQLKEEMRQQALMHQAIVSGLESECQSLSDECFDVNGKLKDKNDYVITLEDIKCQLMAKLDTLTKDKENLHRRLCDLQTTCNILRQQKLDAKSLSNDSKSVISAVKMLAGIATVHSNKLEGFSCTDISLSTWSDDVDFIARFIEHMSIINQKNSLKIERVKDSIRSPKTLVIRGDDGGHDVAENSSTPKAKGRNVASTELVVVPAQHSDILEDLLCVKNSITSIMSSTKLSTSKKVRRGEMNDAVCNDDLYTDLLNAHDQLKSLSSKIEAMTADQRNYESRILELEQENEKNIMMTRGSPLDVAAISSSDERMKVGALLLSNMQQRHNRLLLQNAFKAWNSKVHMCKQVSIAKDMAKELIKTRNTVLLLKSQMVIE